MTMLCITEYLFIGKNKERLCLSLSFWSMLSTKTLQSIVKKGNKNKRINGLCQIGASFSNRYYFDNTSSVAASV